MGLLSKVLLRALPSNDFSNLLSFAEQNFMAASEDGKTAKWLLKIYFKQPLDAEEMELLCDQYYMAAQHIWLEAVRKRKLSEIETSFLIKRFPWNQFRHFPAELSKANLISLFDERDPYKLITYCRDYALPEDFELLLVEMYYQNLVKTDEKMLFTQSNGNKADGWEKALIAYLEGGHRNDNRCTSAKVQKAILELRNTEITQKLVSRCDITTNNLTYESVSFLIDYDYDGLLRILLRDSYLDRNFEKLLKAKAPYLLAQYHIAALRRKAYLEGVNSPNYWRAIMFNKHEQRLAKLCEDTAYKNEFVNYQIKPFLVSFGPCMCAYLAYHFPNLAPDLYRSLRSRF